MFFFVIITFFENKISCSSYRYSQEIENFHLICCSFFNINYLHGEGAIVSIKSDQNLFNLIELCLFNNCSSYSNLSFIGGGAILLYCSNGQSILTKLYSFKSLINVPGKHGQFFYSYVSSNKKNNCSFISVSGSTNEIDRRNSLWIDSGIQLINNINSSNNKLTYHSGLSIISSNSVLIKYSNFFNNYVEIYNCLLFRDSFGNLSYSNIIQNNCPKLSDGIIKTYGSSIFSLFYCIFFNNLNYLFYTQGGSLLVYNSYINHSLISIGSSQIHLNQGNIYSFTLSYLFKDESIFCSFSNQQKKKFSNFNFIFIFFYIVLIFY